MSDHFVAAFAAQEWISLCFNQVLEVNFPTNYLVPWLPLIKDAYKMSMQNYDRNGYSVNPRNMPILKNCMLTISVHCCRGSYELTGMKTFCKL